MSRTRSGRPTVSDLLILIAAPFALATATMAAYLLALSAAGLLTPQRRAHRPAGPGPKTRFAVLVPAHDEAKVIARLLRSLADQSYPMELRAVFVVADNCTDETAAIARREGAIVHERTDGTLRAKGHALRWLLEQVKAPGRYDAIVVFDADSVVSPNFLAVMDARLAGGAQVIQAHYRSLNAESSPVAALREAALASLHYLRPLGRQRLGLSCGLKGNGMCFDAAIIERFGWTATGLAEDVELHLALVREHIRVEFASDAVVRADMPVTLSDARSQNLRWEAGRLSTVRREVLPLLGRGLRERDAVAVDAAVEQLIPPLSVALSAAAGSSVLGVAAGSPTVAVLGLAGGIGLALHVVLGLVAIGAPARQYRALLGAPGYVVWKLALYGRALVMPAGAPWIRTNRADAADDGGHGA